MVSDIRFFTMPAGVYESARAALDLAFGLPNGKAETCLPPAADAPQHHGACVIPLRGEWAQWPEVAAMLEQMTASGAVTEISLADFMASRPVPPALP